MTKIMKESYVLNETLVGKLALNVMSLRRDYNRALLDEQNRDVDQECGYPEDITPEKYRRMYDRVGIAHRVVVCLPEESWVAAPEVYEGEESDQTEFDKAWTELEKEKHVSHFWARVDEVSGIGRFGILLLGLDDGKTLAEPVEGIDAVGNKTGKADHGLLYLRAFDESMVEIESRETDVSNPRYGQPIKYKVMFQDDSGTGGTTTQTDQLVHWSRIIHVADGRRTSEVLGTPRMESVYNRLLDIRKVLSSSGEMYWRGAFPGLFLGVDKDITDAGFSFSTEEQDEIKDHVEDYMNGMQRYMALSGMKAEMLSPTVVDPNPHVDANLNAIAIALSIPKRILFGSEQAELASTQDKTTWAARMTRRQEMYLVPMIIRPTIDRFIALGVLPEPKEYTAVFPDLHQPTDKDKAELGKARMEAVAKYVQSGADQLIAPGLFFTIILGLSTEEAKAITDEMEEMLKEEERLADVDANLVDEVGAEEDDNEEDEQTGDTGKGDEDGNEDGEEDEDGE